MFDSPCTQALWEAVMGENPSRFKGPDRPVESVSWDQCQEFLQRLNTRCTGLELKLLSEAQWEYACRAGTKTPRYREDLNEIAWYGGNSQGETHPVGQKDPNDWGLYDTLGNVLEWCEDVWTEDYNKKKEARAVSRRVCPPRDPGWLLGRRRTVRAPRVPVPLRALVPARPPGLSLCRVQGSGTGRSEPGGGASGGARRSGCGAPRRPRPSERSGLDQRRCGGNGFRGVRDSGTDLRPFGRRASHTPYDSPSLLGFRHRSGPVWALGGGHDRGASRKAAQEKHSKKKNGPGRVQPASVRQRLRWIPPGRFLMGSPDDEEGRGSDEGPQHEVTIGSGFWMFDTPCTQALWEALMGKNPSRFQSRDRPVESVTWKDCQEFLRRLNAKVGLSLSLPSESQWEYACRAGTTEATYAGPLEIKGINNAPILDAIAWYVGNSGIDFELSNGYDASNWPEKQFTFGRGDPSGRQETAECLGLVRYAGECLGVVRGCLGE